jgi:hypothetical protein
MSGIPTTWSLRRAASGAPAAALAAVRTVLRALRRRRTAARRVIRLGRR